ncbi:MAG: rhomboid family intramembrane serine protease [Sphingobacteriales bacterium]|jgi:membrane associated rhomboid family serine protease|nr:rhomboid family intramembrane serine protease [Sphingobacteriales bacterium]
MSSDYHRPGQWQILPLVVKNLLIVNGILYFATVVLGEKLDLDLTRYLGLYLPGSEYFRPHQFITHLFMHGSLMHLFSNMFALWMFGNVLENHWGPRRFMVFYLVTGLGAALIHTLIGLYEIDQVRMVIDAFSIQPDPDQLTRILGDYHIYITPKLQEFIAVWRDQPGNTAYLEEAQAIGQEIISYRLNVPTVGASGAVFGVLLAFGMMFPNTIIYLYFAIPMKAKWFVLLYGLFELYSGIQANPQDNVAHFAHLGGMLFAFILIRLWNRDRHHYGGGY